MDEIKEKYQLKKDIEKINQEKNYKIKKGGRHELRKGRRKPQTRERNNESY